MLAGHTQLIVPCRLGLLMELVDISVSQVAVDPWLLDTVGLSYFISTENSLVSVRQELELGLRKILTTVMCVHSRSSSEPTGRFTFYMMSPKPRPPRWRFRTGWCVSLVLVCVVWACACTIADGLAGNVYGTVDFLWELWPAQRNLYFG